MSNKFSVTKNGIPLDPRLYIWDEDTKTFSTDENGLVLDFGDFTKVTFTTGGDCAFVTGSHCIFHTGYGCTFIVGSSCSFHNIAPQCVLVRRDVLETYILPVGSCIKLNSLGDRGYTEDLLAMVAQKLNSCDIETLRQFLEMEDISLVRNRIKKPT